MPIQVEVRQSLSAASRLACCYQAWALRQQNGGKETQNIGSPTSLQDQTGLPSLIMLMRPRLVGRDCSGHDWEAFPTNLAENCYHGGREVHWDGVWQFLRLPRHQCNVSPHKYAYIVITCLIYTSHKSARSSPHRYIWRPPTQKQVPSTG